LEQAVRHKVPLFITSLGAVPGVVEAVHSYGGRVFDDVVNRRHGEKAVEAGVDGIIAVCAKTGGHADTLSPFALVSEIREIFNGTILLGGAMSTGEHVAAARTLGAHLAYLGPRFIATREAMVSQEQKQMIVDTTARDIVYTPSISDAGTPSKRRYPVLRSKAITGLLKSRATERPKRSRFHHTRA
jgi:nitronate monooxygenase